MPDRVDSTPTAETGGRKEDPPASEVEINFTWRASENILQLFFTVHVYYIRSTVRTYDVTDNLYNFRRLFFQKFAVKGWNVMDSITFLSRKIPGYYIFCWTKNSKDCEIGYLEKNLGSSAPCFCLYLSVSLPACYSNQWQAQLPTLLIVSQ